VSDLSRGSPRRAVTALASSNSESYLSHSSNTASAVLHAAMSRLICGEGSWSQVPDEGPPSTSTVGRSSSRRRSPRCSTSERHSTLTASAGSPIAAPAAAGGAAPGGPRRNRLVRTGAAVAGLHDHDAMIFGAATVVVGVALVAGTAKPRPHDLDACCFALRAAGIMTTTPCRRFCKG